MRNVHYCFPPVAQTRRLFLWSRPHVSGDFCIRKSFYANTPSVHTCPPYTLGVSGDFCVRSPEWKFLYTLCIRIRVDARILIFLYTLSSQYQNLLTNPLRCPDTNRIRVDGRIRFVYATFGRRYFCIRIIKFADTKISGYVWTGPVLSATWSPGIFYSSLRRKIPGNEIALSGFIQF